MLTTIDEVIEKLGGEPAAAKVAGVSVPAVHNWRYRDQLPRAKFFQIEAALRAKGHEVDRSLFGFVAHD
jgi:hypothetical protein